MNNYMKIIINALKQWIDKKLTAFDDALENKMDRTEVINQINAHNKDSESHGDIRNSVDKLSNLVGNTAVSEQIDAAVSAIEIPEQAQANWSQNDSTRPDYVKGRTHYEENNQTVIEWDGSTDTTGSDSFEYGSSTFAKISNITPGVEELDSAIIAMTVGGNTQAFAVKDQYGDSGNWWLVQNKVINFGGMVLIVHDTDIEEGVTETAIPSTGTYFNLDMVNTFAAERLSLTYGSTVVHPLNEKFIPNSIARVSDIPESKDITVNGVSPDENGNIEIEVGSEQIQADLSQNDETAGDYVKNRTHWEELLTNTIEWDGENGDVSELEYFTNPNIDIRGKWYKLSDNPIIVDGVIPAYSLDLVALGEVMHLSKDDIPEDEFQNGWRESSGGWYFAHAYVGIEDNIIENSGLILSVEKEHTIYGSAETIHVGRGTYFLYVPATTVDGEEYQEVYVRKFEYDTVAIHTLDEKFIPDSVKAQPDWNQNDETAVDFVKNRTHWKEETVEILFSEDNIDFSETVSRPETFQLEAEAYNIVIDGEDHYYDLATYNGNNYIGDRYGDPIIVTVEGGNLLMAMEDGGVHSIKIFAISRNYHFNDWFVKEIQGDWEESNSDSPAYVKNKPFYQFVNENGVIFSGAYDVESKDGLYSIQDITVDRIPILGKYYRVYISGPYTPHTYKLKEYQGALFYLGNLSIANSSLENTGEKFLIVFSSDKSSLSIYSTSIINAAEPYSNNAYVIGPCIDYHTIDEKYLPNTIARKSDVLIQSDWNQDVMSQPDYIKNRTHWLESGVSLLAEQPAELTFTDVTEGGYTPPEGYIWCNNFPGFTGNLSAGQRYVVIWNGKQYELTCESKDWKELYKDSNGYTRTIVHGYTNFIGNTDLCTIGGLYMSYSDQELISIEYDSPLTNSHPDVPFIICQGVYDTRGVTDYANRSQYGMYIQKSEPRSAELEIYKGVHLYHTLDERYIPDTIARVTDIKVDTDTTLTIEGQAADAKAVGAALAEKQPVGNYLTEIPAGYVTDEELNSKGYLTEHQSLEGYATEEYVNSKIDDTIPIPSVASVGQALLVKAVDENGKPTEWECAEFASAGEVLELVSDIFGLHPVSVDDKYLIENNSYLVI